MIQRYKFHVYFFLGTNTFASGGEHEVYYEDYVPDPIEDDGSMFQAEFHPLKYGQKSYMIITWTNLYMDFPATPPHDNGLVRNYFFEFEFYHSNAGWDYNLGWSATANYYDFHEVPCIIEINGTPDTAKKCELYPGGAAGTTSYLRVWGFAPFTLNDEVKFHIPRIQFGTNTALSPSMRMYLHENTPGENTHFIPIIFYDYTINSGTINGIGAPNYNAFSTDPALGSDQPEIETTLTYAFTTVATDPDYILYEYPDPFYVAGGRVACTGGTCYIFNDADGENWIVFKPSAGQGTSASTVVNNFDHSPYSSVGNTFTFTARVVLSGDIANNDFKTHNLVLTPGAITTTTWVESVAEPNPEVNENSRVLFDLEFTTITIIPDDSSFTVDFVGASIPTDRQEFYCQIRAGLTAFDARGVYCERISATELRVYNFQSVAAGATPELTIGLLTTTVTGIDAQVTTFYDRTSSANRVVDQTGTLSETLTFDYDNFNSLSIQNDREGLLVRAG